jgi:hypothetical protein
MRTTLALLMLLALAGCGHDDDSSPAGHDSGAGPAGGLHAGGSLEWPSAEARRLDPDDHPTPYTAEQIRQGCPDGRTCTFRMSTAGGHAVMQEWRFTAPDAEGVTWTSLHLDEHGDPSGQSNSSRRTWKELQQHASYPSEATTVREERVETPAGAFDCMLYTVTQQQEDSTVVSKYWFAWQLPGPPVKMEQRMDGKLVGSMEMLSNEVRG